MLNDVEFPPAELFAAALEGSPDPMSISLYASGTIVQINAAFLRVTGYSKDEVLGRTSSEIGVWVEQDGREQFLASLGEEGKANDLEISFRSKDGSVRRYRGSASVVPISGRDCIILSCRDTTEREELAQRLEKSTVLLERTEEMSNIGSWEFDYATRRVTASAGAHRI